MQPVSQTKSSVAIFEQFKALALQPSMPENALLQEMMRLTEQADRALVEEKMRRNAAKQLMLKRIEDTCIALVEDNKDLRRQIAQYSTQSTEIASIYQSQIEALQAQQNASQQKLSADLQSQADLIKAQDVRITALLYELTESKRKLSETENLLNERLTQEATRIDALQKSDTGLDKRLKDLSTQTAKIEKDLKQTTATFATHTHTYAGLTEITATGARHIRDTSMTFADKKTSAPK